MRTSPEWPLIGPFFIPHGAWQEICQNQVSVSLNFPFSVTGIKN
jgi:hypothetical protein